MAFYRGRMKLVGIAATALLVASIGAAAGCSNEARNESITLANAGNKAASQKQFDEAIVNYQKAVARWSENHLAWYALGGSYFAKQDYAKASDAFSNAVRIVPEQATYQMNYGNALYERAVAAVRDDQAKREGKKPAEVTVDLSTVNFETATQHLQEAVKLDKDLWRPHYLLGKIFRDTGKSKEAATELTAALRLGPTEPAPWVALAELYRQWDYTDQAIQIAETGATVVPGVNERSDVWYEVGMGYSDKNLGDRAIEALTKSLDAKHDNQRARFQRGQAYFRKGDYANAKPDLEQFSKAGGASVQFEKQQASKMLIDIAAKSVVPGSTPVDAPPPTEVVKKGKRR
jgi:cytochrome c-type biogenesis protein CcmH/NrfG